MRPNTVRFAISLCGALIALSPLLANSFEISAIEIIPDNCAEGGRIACRISRDGENEAKIQSYRPDSGITITIRPRRSSSNAGANARIGATTRERYVAVAGYQLANYVFGEVELLNREEIAGYIYKVNDRPTIIYIYGKRVGNSRIEAYDKQGNYFALQLVDADTAVYRLRR